MKKPRFLSAYMTAAIIVLVFASSGCGKKSAPVIPSAPVAAPKPVTVEPAKPAVVETPRPSDVKVPKPAAKTANLQLHVTARLGGRDVRGGFNVPDHLVNQNLTFNWNVLENAADYKITVLMHRLSRRTDSVAKITPFEEFTGNNTFFTIPEIRPSKRYSFTVTAYDASGNALREENVNFRTSRITRPVPEEDFFLKGTSTMEYVGKSVKVPVWKLDKNGKKYGSTLNITVHQAIADIVLTIFNEIYNGSEQFPIYEAGGYRNDGSHSLGLAIDINANENMYISGNEARTVGKLWEPYNNPYSITPYGDVVTAFERHGFAWGGDSWSNVDYMHFFYLNDTYPLYGEGTPIEDLPHLAFLFGTLPKGTVVFGGDAYAAQTPSAVRQNVIPRNEIENHDKVGSDQAIKTVPKLQFDEQFEAELREKSESGGRAALNNFSNQLMSQGTRLLDSDLDAAIAALRKAIGANPGNQRAHAWLVYAFLTNGRTAEAQTAIDQAAEAGFNLSVLSNVNARLSAALKNRQ